MSAKEGKQVWKIPPCPVYDVEGMESWLSDMARQGLLLCKDGFFAGFATFERKEPCEMRYRLEPAQRRLNFWSDKGVEPDEEAEELNASYGWEYIASRGQFYIYQTREPGTRELNTDPAVLALALDSVRKRERGSFFSLLFWLIVYPLIFFYGGVVQLMLALGTWRFAWGAVIAIWALWSSAAALASMRRLRKKLAAGQQPDHRKNWKRRAVWYKAEMFSFLVVLMAWIICLVEAWKADVMEVNVHSLEEAGPYPFVTLSDLVDEGSYQVSGMDFFNQVETRSDWLAPVMIDYRESGSGLRKGEDFSGGLTVVYVETVTPWLAKELGREYLASAKWERNYSPIDLEGLELDVDWWAAYNDIFPTLILQKENKIAKISFYQTGEGDYMSMEEWATIFANNF